MRRPGAKARPACFCRRNTGFLRAFFLTVFPLGLIDIQAFREETIMRVSDILNVKGNALFTVTPDTPLHEAITTMASHDIGSLVVIEYADFAARLMFRGLILT